MRGVLPDEVRLDIRRILSLAYAPRRLSAVLDATPGMVTLATGTCDSSGHTANRSLRSRMWK
jgi:hypothetical protein